MGERTRAAIGFALIAAAFCAPQAAAQSRSPAGDTGARGLAGSVVQFEEVPSRSIVYMEQQGGLVSPVAPIVERPAAGATPSRNPPPQTAAKAAKAPERITKNGASSLRAPQRQAAAAEAAAIRR